MSLSVNAISSISRMIPTQQSVSLSAKDRMQVNDKTIPLVVALSKELICGGTGERGCSCTAKFAEKAFANFGTKEGDIMAKNLVSMILNNQDNFVSKLSNKNVANLSQFLENMSIVYEDIFREDSSFSTLINQTKADIQTRLPEIVIPVPVSNVKPVISQDIAHPLMEIIVEPTKTEMIEKPKTVELAKSANLQNHQSKIVELKRSDVDVFKPSLSSSEKMSFMRTTSSASSLISSPQSNTVIGPVKLDFISAQKNFQKAISLLKQTLVADTKLKFDVNAKSVQSALETIHSTLKIISSNSTTEYAEYAQKIIKTVLESPVEMCELVLPKAVSLVLETIPSSSLSISKLQKAVQYSFKPVFTDMSLNEPLVKTTLDTIVQSLKSSPTLSSGLNGESVIRVVLPLIQNSSLSKSFKTSLVQSTIRPYLPKPESLKSESLKILSMKIENLAKIVVSSSAQRTTKNQSFSTLTLNALGHELSTLTQAKLDLNSHKNVSIGLKSQLFKFTLDPVIRGIARHSLAENNIPEKINAFLKPIIESVVSQKTSSMPYPQLSEFIESTVEILAQTLKYSSPVIALTSTSDSIKTQRSPLPKGSLNLSLQSNDVSSKSFLTEWGHDVSTSTQPQQSVIVTAKSLATFLATVLKSVENPQSLSSERLTVKQSNSQRTEFILHSFETSMKSVVQKSPEIAMPLLTELIQQSPQSLSLKKSLPTLFLSVLEAIKPILNVKPELAVSSFKPIIETFVKTIFSSSYSSSSVSVKAKLENATSIVKQTVLPVLKAISATVSEPIFRLVVAQLQKSFSNELSGKPQVLASVNKLISSEHLNLSATPGISQGGIDELGSVSSLLQTLLNSNQSRPQLFHLLEPSSMFSSVSVGKCLADANEQSIELKPFSILKSAQVSEKSLLSKPFYQIESFFYQNNYQSYISQSSIESSFQPLPTASYQSVSGLASSLSVHSQQLVSSLQSKLSVSGSAKTVFSHSVQTKLDSIITHMQKFSGNTQQLSQILQNLVQIFPKQLSQVIQLFSNLLSFNSVSFSQFVQSLGLLPTTQVNQLLSVLTKLPLEAAKNLLNFLSHVPESNRSQLLIIIADTPLQELNEMFLSQLPSSLESAMVMSFSYYAGTNFSQLYNRVKMNNQSGSKQAKLLMAMLNRLFIENFNQDGHDTSGGVVEWMEYLQKQRRKKKVEKENQIRNRQLMRHLLSRSK